MSWVAEFGREYEIPTIVDWMVRQGILEDMSWHNDAMPSFGLVDPANDEYGIRLWVDHPLRALREFQQSTRFVVEEGVFISESDYEHTTDDLQDALMKLVARALQPRYKDHPFRRLPWVDPEVVRRKTGKEWSPRGLSEQVVSEMIEEWRRGAPRS